MRSAGPNVIGEFYFDSAEMASVDESQVVAISAAAPPVHEADAQVSRSLALLDTGSFMVVDLYQLSEAEWAYALFQGVLEPSGDATSDLLSYEAVTVDSTSSSSDLDATVCTTACSAVGSVVTKAAGFCSSAPGVLAKAVCLGLAGLGKKVVCSIACNTSTLIRVTAAPPDCPFPLMCTVRGEGSSTIGYVTSASTLIEWWRSPTPIYTSHDLTPNNTQITTNTYQFVVTRTLFMDASVNCSPGLSIEIYVSSGTVSAWSGSGATKPVGTSCSA